MRAITDDVLSAAEFHSLLLRFAPLPVDSRLALAVSGGPDSMALAYLTKRWCDDNKAPPPMAFIVDHALRPESASEAEEVRNRLESMGVPAEILRWEHPLVAARLHVQARKARYQLLLNACRKHGISTILLGHQREDQAETILMRFAKGTGIDGLAGIAAESAMDGIRILRPLLTVSKQQLIATCVDASVPYVTDPSNSLEKFARGRLRRVMPLLADEGLTVDRLTDCGVRAREARDALDFYTSEFLKQHSRQDAYGVIALDKEKLCNLPRAIALRSLSLALQTIHAEDYAPLHASLSVLLDALQNEEPMPPRTLNGCLVGCRKNQIVMSREPASVTENVTIRVGESVTWDGVWRVTLAAGSGSDIYQVRALGQAQHEVIDGLSSDLRRKVQQGRVRAVLPALWLGNQIAMIPFGDVHQRAKAELQSKWPYNSSN